MFAPAAPRKADEDQKDIFAPVADLMVGVVFIFIVLILALSLDLATEKSVPQSAYDALAAKNATLLADNAKLVSFVRFIRDSEIAPLMQRLSRADQTRTAILDDMQARLAALDVHVKVDPAAGTLMLPSTTLFASGQAEPIVPDGRDTILRLGQVMSDVLPCYSPVADGERPPGCSAPTQVSQLSAVYVEGHTDVVPYGSPNGRFRNNWDLSAGRAIEAFTLIRDRYGQLRSLKNGDGDAVLGVSGYADTRPAERGGGDRSSPELADRDRRIEVRIIMATNEELVGAVLKELKARLEGVDGLVH
jgi:flagellar motor protein MotB